MNLTNHRLFWSRQMEIFLLAMVMAVLILVLDYLMMLVIGPYMLDW